MRGIIQPTIIENGCELYYDCFSCPFSECLLPTDRAIETPKARVEACNLHEIGYSLEQIAKKLGKSKAAIKRWLHYAYSR